MNPKNRQQFVLLHVLLAGFFLPAAVMFSITGGLYTFGIKGDYQTSQYDFELSSSETPSIEELTTRAKDVSISLKTQVPSGEPTLKKVGTSWIFEWTGSSFDLTIEPTNTINKAKLTIKETTLHRYFVQLHKAKGGKLFKIMAGSLAVAFLLLFLSGILMAFSNPKLKPKLYLSAALGLIAFIALALLS